MERGSSGERPGGEERPAGASEGRPAGRIEPEDAKPAEDGPRDSDLRPEVDTDHVVEEKGEVEPER